MPFQMSAVSAPLDRRARAHAALKACQALQQRRLMQVTGLLSHVWPQAQNAMSYFPESVFILICHSQQRQC